MELLILFAFLAGVVTIVSPCVLPVLPILLSTSSNGGKLRPVGIVLGLAVTFSVVTLAVTAAAEALAVPATWLRIVSIVMLGFFGLALLVPALGAHVEHILSPLARLAGSNGKRSGFGGGMVIGAGLGLLWAPCVGPIMASVIGLTATVGLTPQAVLITLAYSVGTALPMLVLAYGGRGLAMRARKLGPRTNLVKQTFGALTVVACVALFLGADTALQTFTLRNLPPGYTAFLQSFERGDTVEAELDRLQKEAEGSQGSMSSVTQAEPTQASATSTPAVPLEDMGQAPELTGITQWWNSEPLTLEGLRGKVVIIDFWTYGCYNCANTRPYVRELYDKYRSQGLEIIGVHTPELSFEYIPENVEKGIQDQKVNWPVAFDPDYKTWRSYDNHWWPAFYFVDAMGRIRYRHIGEGNYENNERVVQQLLEEAKSVSSMGGIPAQAEATPTQEPKPTATPEPTMTPTPKPGIALKDLGPAPELTGTTDWINSEPLTLASLRGKVVIVNFWTFGCYNCVNTLPYVRDLYARYHDQGLEILGVHTPEFAYERVLDNVRSNSKRLGVEWPVVLDPDYKTWRAYENHYWPAFYFVDAKGHIRYTHFGEGNYEMNEKVVQQLLEEAKDLQ
ncbi:MAG: redoxin domain-containing protein [Chloroflexia bacterium]